MLIITTYKCNIQYILHVTGQKGNNITKLLHLDTETADIDS